MNEEQRQYEEMKLFSNKLRRDIIKMLYEVGTLSFTMIKEELTLTDGRLYFHLKKLSNYIEKDQQNYYRLNEEGRRIYSILFKESKDSFIARIVEEKLEKGSDKKREIRGEEEDIETPKLFNILAPPSFFYFWFGSKTRSIIELSVLLIIIAWLFGVTHQYFSEIEKIVSGSAIVIAITNLIHWFLYFILIVLELKLFHKELSLGEITISVIAGAIPYYFYLIPVAILSLLNITWGRAVTILFLVLFIIVKAWSTIVISQGLSISTHLSAYKTILIALSLIFVDYVYLLFTI